MTWASCGGCSTVPDTHAADCAAVLHMLTCSTDQTAVVVNLPLPVGCVSHHWLAFRGSPQQLPMLACNLLT